MGLKSSSLAGGLRREGEVGQWVEMLAAKHVGLSLNLGTYVEEGENQLLHIVL